MVKFLMLVMLSISSMFGFVDLIRHSDVNNVIKYLKKDCKMYHTAIYTSCYSKTLNRAVFSAYIVDKRSYEVNIEKRPRFYSDMSINRHYPDAYKKTGYDKGHLAFDAAFDYDPYALDLTYNLELNIVPMKADVNRFQWSQIEKKILKIAKDTDVLVVDMMSPSSFTLGVSEINIPAKLYKAISYSGMTECYMVDNMISSLNRAPYMIECSELSDIIKKYELGEIYGE